MKKWLTYVWLAGFSTLLFFLWAVLGWFLALFVKDEKLPRWLSWFDTPDAYLTGAPFDPVAGGGDIGFYQTWLARERKYPRMAWLIAHIRRWFWLCRNPSNGWDHGPAARTVKAHLMLVLGIDPDSVRPREGLLRIKCPDNPVVWEYYRIIKLFKAGKIGNFQYRGRCIRIRLGWKLKPFIGKSGEYSAQCVMAITPFKEYLEH